MAGTCCKIINRRSHQGASHRITWTGCFYRKYLVASSARGVADAETINTDDIVTSVELKKKEKKRKQKDLSKTGGKIMHGHFARES